MRFLSYTKTNNIGDCAASPLNYFAWLFPKHSKDNFEASVAGETAIIGGGGLVFNETLPRLASLGPSYAWGIGSNFVGVDYPVYPDLFDRWPLVGVRDVGTRFRWVPCPSCMHHGFDNQYTPTHRVVAYIHRSTPTHLRCPTMMNNELGKDIGSVISFIGSGESLVTTSYHGVYWALLLGRNVTCLSVHHSRFFGFPTKTRFFHSSRAMSYYPVPGLLTECRTKTIEFALEIKKAIT